MIKLSLKRLQPNWPCDEEMSRKLTSIRRLSDTSIFRFPTKTILKNVWLKGLPIGRRSITTINASSLNDACQHIEGLNLHRYLHGNNPRLEINNDTITSVIHVAFNMMGLIHRHHHDAGGVLFDYIVTHSSNRTPSITIHNVHTCILSIANGDISNLESDLSINNYIEFWQKIRDLYRTLIGSMNYGLLARTNSSERRLEFPARRSGFCSIENRVDITQPETFTTTRFVFNQNNNIGWEIGQELLVATTNEDLLTRRMRAQPRRQELNPRIQECIQILNEHSISEETRFHIYELILACTNDTL